MSKADRFNGNKVEFDDVPMLGMVEVAKVSAFGKNKYARNNWRKGAPTSQYINAALRHLFKHLYGERIDKESKCSHLGHVAWNILALLEKIAMNKEDNDLYTYESDVEIDSLFNINNPDGLTADDLNNMEKEFNEK